MAFGFYEQLAPSLLRLCLATTALLAMTTGNMQCYFGIVPLDIPEIVLIWKIQWGLACPDHKIGKEALQEKCQKESIVSDRF